MTPYFQSESQVAALEEAASSWLGTPFSANAQVKGRGVSCQKLVAALYEETGFWSGVEVPEVPMDHALHSPRSLVTEWATSRADLEEVPWACFEDLRPGDVLGFLIYKTIHHTGVMLGSGRFIHALNGSGVVLSSFNDPTFASRLSKVWRPVA